METKHTVFTNEGSRAPRGNFEELIAQLETLVDASTLERVLDALSEMAGLKAAHIRETWQDKITAKTWDRAARILATAGSKVRC